MKKTLTLPTVLTILRIVFSPVFFVLLLASKATPGLVIFIIVALTDWIDGMIAKYTKQITKFGEFLDPMADKFMVALGVIAITLKFDFPIYGLWILSRDIISLCGSFIIYKKRKANWEANKLGKATTFLQVVTIIAFIINNSLKFHILLVTMITSILTAISYFRRTIRIVKASK
ncbi:CDP-alcohol phosphatidyltransferase family protein [Candidatus Woesearchaeota archaeon]|nr:CDP-alcohol phosphatidyltransferase family protein [Candidatus Woesearchaeota archaeon]